MGSSSTKLDPVVIPLVHGESVLDVGCGYGRWGFLLFSNYWEGYNAKAPVVDGIDAYAPSVEFCKKLPVYRKVWHHELPKPLVGKWDVVLASEIIEHLSPSDVPKALAVLEKAAKKRVILTTPSFECMRGGGDTHFGHNDFEAHKSYVTAAYLKKRGYKILSTGFGNPNTIYGKLGEFLFSSSKSNGISIEESKKSLKTGAHRMPLLQNISLRLESVARLSPYFSAFVVAYKDID